MKLTVKPHFINIKGKNLDYKQVQLVHAISEVVLSVIQNTTIVKSRTKKRKAVKARKTRGIGPRDNNDY